MKKGSSSGKDGKKGAGDAIPDDALWDYVTRSIRAYVTTHATRDDPPPKKPAKAGKPKKEPAPLADLSVLTRLQPGLRGAATTAKGAQGGILGGTAAGAMDKSTETKLKKGKLPIDGRLDLHGMTQEEAFRALERFVMNAVKNDKRTLLIITGKGARSEGVLKRRLPDWLSQPPIARHILALTPAAAKDGGGGAWYVRLRRSRD